MNTDRYNKVMEGAAYWASYYRENPDVFVEEYLHIKLRLFQKILITLMFLSTTFVWVAARGQGKSFLSAVYCCARAILYPGTRICIASGTRGQAQNVIEKIIQELKPRSAELRSEINDKETKMNGTSCIVTFNNSSVIKVVTASDSARGNRCNVLLLDEYRLISKTVIDTILRKFLTFRRMPVYADLTDKERNEEYNKEKNLTLYLSSAFFKSHWSYDKCLDTFKAMLDDRRRQFVCAFPYQLSILEGLLDPEMIRDEMSETDFSEVKFGMEMEALFFGSNENAFFDFETVSKSRRLNYPMLPDALAMKLNNSSSIKITPKQNGEIRILSADIALMSSKKHNNDATSVFINQMIPAKSGKFTSNIIYPDSYEGLRTDDQALIIRRLFEEYSCDYIVLDTNGKTLPFRMVTYG